MLQIKKEIYIKIFINFTANKLFYKIINLILKMKVFSLVNLISKLQKFFG